MATSIIDFAQPMERGNDTPEIEKIAGLFPRGYISIFASQAGTGKTWFMQYLACRLSCGGNILQGLVVNSEKKKIDIFAGETGKYLLDKRLSKTVWQIDESMIKVYDAVELQRAGIPVMLNTPEGKLSFITAIANDRPDIVYIDTLISFHNADESKQSEITGMYTFLLKTAREFNCAVVLNHHTRKRSTKAQNTKLTQDEVIGSSAGTRLASMVFIAERYEDNTQNDEGMPRVVVRNVKSWDKRIPDFSYKFTEDENTHLLDFTIDWNFTSNENGLWSVKERVTAFIKEMDLCTYLTPENLSAAFAITKENARYYLDKFTNQHILRKTTIAGKTVWGKEG